MSEDSTKVLFIGSYGRSGSTLLDVLLGRCEGFFSAGELRYIWERGLAEDQLCGCGKTFKSCEFWNAVFEEAFGGFQNVDIERVRELQTVVDRINHIPSLISLPHRRSFDVLLAEYTLVLGKLYRAIRRISGCEVIVDSSKYPSYGFVLRLVPGVKLYILHLIRDSRAVAHSWQRKRIRPEIHWKQQLMPLISPPRSAVGWSVNNILLHVLGYVNRHYLITKYEDLVTTPATTLSKAITHVGEAVKPSQLSTSSSVNLEQNHTVSGNPMRFQRGEIRIRPDLDWCNNMKPSHKLLVSALTWPLLWVYSYLR